MLTGWQAFARLSSSRTRPIRLSASLISFLPSSVYLFPNPFSNTPLVVWPFIRLSASKSALDIRLSVS